MQLAGQETDQDRHEHEKEVQYTYTAGSDHVHRERTTAFPRVQAVAGLSYHTPPVTSLGPNNNRATCAVACPIF